MTPTLTLAPIRRSKMAKMKLHDETHCVYCEKPLPIKGVWKNYCGRDCAWNDGDRWESDRRSDMSRYYEV